MRPGTQVAPHAPGPQTFVVAQAPTAKSQDAISNANLVSRSEHSNGFVAEVVVLTPRARVGLWLLLMTVVLANTAILVAFAITYQKSNTRNSTMWFFRVYYLSYAGSTFVKHAAPAIAVGYAVLAAGFALFGTHLIYTSIKVRGLQFGAESTVGVTTRRVSVSRTRSFIVVSHSAWVWVRHQIASVRYLVGVRGPYFDLRMLVDDIVELGSQTTAAYISSRTISNVKLNLTYGIVIFCTTICPVVFRWVYKNSLVKQRMAGLVTDLVLDFVWGTLLPLWMIVPVVHTVSSTTFINDFDGITSLTRESERVVILSWKNYVLSVFPFIATLFNLIEIQSILREVRSSKTALTNAQAAPGVTVLKLTYAVVGPRHGILYRAIYCLLPVYGLAVLVASIVATQGYVASSTTNAYDCVHRVYPWFERNESCAGRRINCTFAGITGTADELEAAFDSFNARLLTDLLISDCTALTLPQRMRRLNQLELILVKDSYIVQWGSDASIGGGNFPHLRAVNFNFVAFAEIPTGLVAEPLAPHVEYIHLLGVANATQLLDAVGTNWAALRFFDCMFCDLTEFHPAIKAMYQVSTLALGFNAIPSIPEDWTVDPTTARIEGIWIDMNPGLSSIPDSFWRQTATCATFSIESTNVSSVPEWLPDVADEGLVVFAANTPLCAQLDRIPARVRSIIVCETVY